MGTRLDGLGEGAQTLVLRFVGHDKQMVRTDGDSFGVQTFLKQGLEVGIDGGADGTQIFSFGPDLFRIIGKIPDVADQSVRVGFFHQKHIDVRCVP